MADIGSEVAGKVVKSLIVLAKKEIGYMWNCSENVERFKHEAEKLKLMRGRVQELIDISIRKGDRLSYGVEDWEKEAHTEISKAGEFIEEEASAKNTCCKIGLCGNWGTLHRYGKRATKMAPSLLRLLERGSAYESCVSIETPVPRPLDVYQNKLLDDLHTHNSALGDIIKSLEDESIQITGIYGLGGVGKTTLAKEVVARLKKTNMLFADVAFTSVSQKVHVENIQEDLKNARKRIMNGDKILIILDDVWEKLDLEELCIPCGNNYMNCKILFTSRSEKVCQKMSAQSIICVKPLPTEEAWILFKRVVGERLEMDDNLKPVAEEVAKECGGLPLLIQAVGNALKDESIGSWNLALSRLKKPVASEMDPEIEKAFTRLQLSYDYLKSEEAKSCFLLCSMFTEDTHIPLEELVHYGVGLEKFDDLDSIDDARGRVQNAVNILTSSGLLLDSKRGEGFTRMHDVVRDVALLIASQCNYKFLVKSGKGLTEWLPRDNGLDSYKGIALMHNAIIKLPDYKVNIPQLEIFLVFFNRSLSMISDKFIGCMVNVKVLDVSWDNISYLPQSFKLLTKLRMLDLSQNKFLDEISILGALIDLEILILNGTGITEIPKEIAQLVNLKVFEVLDCGSLSCITQGVISALSRLEELCIDLSMMSEGVNGCIVEIMKLSKLTYLDLKVKSFDLIPQNFYLENLKGFVIQIGNYYGRKNLGRSDRYLIISSKHLPISLLRWLKKVIEVSCPVIYLYEVQNLNNIMPYLYHRGFNKLEHIELNACPNVSCLVEDGIRCDGGEWKIEIEEKFFKELNTLRLINLNKLEVLWKCPDEYISLTNLVTLYILSCDRLERVFTVRVAQCLVNLKELYIKYCEDLEEVILDGEGGDDESEKVIVLPSLATISLYGLPKLQRFFKSNGHCSIEYPSLVDVKILASESIEIWGPGIHKTPNLKTLLVNGDVLKIVNGSNSINEAVEKLWRKCQVDDDDDYDDNDE